MNYEDYEDEITMAHKSVHFISRQPAVAASPEQMESVCLGYLQAYFNVLDPQVVEPHSWKGTDPRRALQIGT